MSRHVFQFSGGEDLTTMGATWFVSFYFYKEIDHNHLNWRKVSTYKNRESVFNRINLQMKKFYLNQILEMDITNLNKNKLDLNGLKIKEMARELLARI